MVQVWEGAGGFKAKNYDCLAKQGNYFLTSVQEFIRYLREVLIPREVDWVEGKLFV